MRSVICCWASGWPDMRAECIVGGTKVEAATVPHLAQKLLFLGAPDDWYMMIRWHNHLMTGNNTREHRTGSYSGYQSATIRAFAEGRYVPPDTKMKWNGRFEWMRAFGV